MLQQKDDQSPKINNDHYGILEYSLFDKHISIWSKICLLNTKLTHH